MTSLGMNKVQESVLNNHLSVGGFGYNGTMINAIQNGIYTSFQGCYFIDSTGAMIRTVIDGDDHPYRMCGVSQLMYLYSADSSDTTAGFPNASAAGDRGVLRLTNNDTNTTALAMTLNQGNALWIAPSTDFTCVFDIAQWTQRSDAITTQWAEFGVVGNWDATSSYNSARQIGYLDNTNDSSFAVIKLGANQGRLVYKATNTGAATTATTSAAFDLPTGAFVAKLIYSHGINTGTPTLSVYINNVHKLSVATTLTGPFQLCARTCHSASYASATQAPTILDIDAIYVSVPV